MIRLATCQLCLLSRPLQTSRTFSISKIKWRKAAAVIQPFHQSTETLEDQNQNDPIPPPSPSVQNATKSNIEVNINPAIKSHPQTTPQDSILLSKSILASQSPPPPSPSINSISDVSSAPIKLLNGVSPRILIEAAAATNKLDYSLLPSYYLGLSKSRLTSLVVVTAMAGYALAPASFALVPFASLTLGTALTSASANTINQIMEVEFDSQMDRTKNRVLVRRNLSVFHAKAFAAVTGVGGVCLLAFGANELTAALGALNLALYTCLYTPMKRRTIANTWIGSVVGGIPPIMGWAACTGELSHGALLLGGLLYAWQFPHFNALSWNLRKDYDKAGYKMMAISHPDLCKKTSLRYSLGIVAMSSLAPVCSVTSWTFVFDSLPLNGYLVYLAYRFYQDGDSKSSRKLFRFSLIHLPVLIVLMMISKQSYKEKDKCVADVANASALLASIEAPTSPILLSMSKSS